MIGDPDLNIADLPGDTHKHDRLASFVADYSAMNQRKVTIDDSAGFSTYCNHLSRRLKNRDRNDAIETILMAPYGDYLERFSSAAETLRKIAPDPNSVNDLKSEEELLAFVQAFRDLIR